MIAAIQKNAIQRSITRLCHFTKSANLLHVLESGYLKDRATLDAEKNAVVNPTDHLRLDNQTSKICCSVEYPNSYYLDIATRNEKVFEGWVILFLKPDLLWQPETMFCERNAAAQNGAMIKIGEAGYNSLFSPQVGNFRRRSSHLMCMPTDMQAEVLVAAPIQVHDIIGIAMKDAEQVLTEKVRWKVSGVALPAMPIYVMPDVFDKIKLRDAIWAGKRLDENRYE